MSSPLLERVGVQTPRFLSRPEASEWADEAVGFCRAAGMELDPWQELCLEVSLGERGDGRWAATEVGLIVPRQNGKGEVLAARELAGLFLFGERLITHSAHEFKTAREAFLRLIAYVERPGNEWMLSAIKHVHRSHGEEGIELRNGNRLNFLARSTGSGRGFTGDCVILDEAYALTDLHMAAIISTLSARSIHGNPQIWYTSSAPLETSTVLHRLRRRGRAGESRYAYLEWSAESVDDPDALEQANPALGIRISAEFVETERGALSPESFARERYGIAPDIDSASAIPLEKWEAVLWRPKPGGPTKLVWGDPVCFSVDTTPDRQWSSIASAGTDVVELVEHRRGTAWVVDRCRELHDSWKKPFQVDGGGPAGAFGVELEREGIPVVFNGGRDVARACNQFYDDIVEGNFRAVDPFAVCTAAVLGAVKKPQGDTWRWDRRVDTDISPLMALTLARWGAVPASDVVPLGAWR